MSPALFIDEMNIQRKKIIDYYFGGALLAVLRPLIYLIGRMGSRSHDNAIQGDICLIKMLGGGSLVIALPALLGIRRRYPGVRIRLITTEAVKPFAESMGGIFDEILVIDDSSIVKILTTTIHAVVRAFGTDTIIDLEVYSRLTTVLSVLTCARNRIGFYLEAAFRRRNLLTHLIFFNRFSGAYFFYEEVARLIDATPASFGESQQYMRQLTGLEPLPPSVQEGAIVVGHGCSGLGPERMLNAEQWSMVFLKKVDPLSKSHVYFLGASGDAALADQIIAKISRTHRWLTIHNLCGQLSLNESIRVIASSHVFLGIDSALLHYARLFGVKTISFWGPTDPGTGLRKIKMLDEEIFYRKIPCSPCIHIAKNPPCNGRAECLRKLFAPLGRAAEDGTVDQVSGSIIQASL